MIGFYKDSICEEGAPYSSSMRSTHTNPQTKMRRRRCCSPYQAPWHTIRPVSYTPESLATPTSNAPKSATSTGTSSRRKFDADAPIETYPRVFSQSFVLINGAGTNAEGGVPFVWMPQNKGPKKSETRTVAKYFIQADCFRFVG